MKAILLALALTLGQCPGGVCPPSAMRPTYPTVRPVFYQQVVPVPVKGWHNVTIDGKSVQVLGWIGADGQVKYWPSDNPTLAASLASPLPTPITRLPIAPAEPLNYGLDVGKIFDHPEVEKYEATSPRARRFVEQAKAGASDLPDDSGKPFLSVIGDPAHTGPVVADFAPGGPLASLKSSLHLDQFKPDEWQVATVALPTNGNPSIVLQAPDGRVIYRQEGYAGGGKALAEELARKLPRKPNPDYDPSKDLGPANGVSDDSVAYVVIGGCVILALVLVARRSKS